MFEREKSVHPPQLSSELSPDFKSAVFWREAVWALACKFSGNQCEMTHSEAENHDGKIVSVAFCVCFFEKQLGDFSEYLRANLQTIGTEHSHMRVYVGFNYGNPGLITVQMGQVTFDKNRDLLDLREMQNIGYGDTPNERQAVKHLQDDVWRRIMRAIEGNV